MIRPGLDGLQPPLPVKPRRHRRCLLRPIRKTGPPPRARARPRVNLLDVNLLVALCDADHVHHGPALTWFRRHAFSGWASCPLTENGMLRVMGSPAYPGGPGTPQTCFRP